MTEGTLGKNISGFSLIAIILSLLILSLFSAVAVSIITTQSTIGLEEEQGMQAFYIAEAGLEHALLYGDTCTCNYNGITGTLGEGGFSVSSVYITNSISGFLDLTNSTVPLPAMPVPGFTNSGYTMPGAIMIDTEYLFCNKIDGNSFIGCKRGFANTTSAIHNGITGSQTSQCSVRSTGSVSKGLGFGSVKRVVQVTVGE